MEITEERIKSIGECSNSIWKAFKNLCAIAEDVKDEDKLIDMAFIEMRDKAEEYKGTDLRVYAVDYSHALLSLFEKFLYRGRLVASNYFEVKRMSEAAFVDYRNNPNPRDVITEVKEDGRQIRWRVEAVIKNE